jgi:Holliday junction resolvasome RuvABC ATP-dependent DNA helicase subunit
MYLGCQNNVNIFPETATANTGKVQIKVPVPQNPSLIFTGREDVLDKLRKIFFHHANTRLISRHSCLLWGMGGIGKTQICLKFMEEMSDK